MISASASVLAGIVAASSAAHVARSIDCDESAVRSWARGRRVPAPAWRAKLAAFDPRLTVEGWSIEASAAAVAPLQVAELATCSEDEPTTSGFLGGLSLLAADADGEGRLLEVIRQCDELYAEAGEPGAHASMRDRTAILATKTTATVRLSRIRGDDSITMAKIAASPGWKRFMHIVLEVLNKRAHENRDLMIELQQRIRTETEGEGAR